MSAPSYSFTVLPGEYAITRLDAGATVPPWAMSGDRFSSVTRTGDELSIVCDAAKVPDGHRTERGWALLTLLGPFPFETTGVLASVAQPLANAGVSVFAISTFDTDYLLVKQAQLDLAITALTNAGHRQA